MSSDPGERYRVLLAFDDGNSSTSWAESLEQAHFQVKPSGRVKDCLKLCQEWKPMVLVANFKLDQGDPLDRCRRLKSNSLTRHIAVLFVAPRKIDEDQEVSALRAGADAVFAPPGSRNLMQARLEAHAKAAFERWQQCKKLIRDELTGVFYRRYLFESLRQHVNQFSRPGPPVLAC